MLRTSPSEDFTTVNLLNYECNKKLYRLLAADFSRQKN